MARDARPSGASGSSDHEVDFVVGSPDDAPDEDLPSGPGPRRNRLRVELGIGAAVLLAGLLVARAVTGSHNTPQAAPTSSSGSTAPAPTGAVTAPPYVYRNHVPGAPTATTPVSFPSDVPTRTGSNPAECPGACSGTSALPADVGDAVQTAFPESTVERSQTIRLDSGRGPLWFREVLIRAGEQQIDLRVQARSASDTTSDGYTSSNGQVTTFYDHRLGPWQVEVHAVDLLGGRVDLSVVRGLGRDPRITVVGG